MRNDSICVSQPGMVCALADRTLRARAHAVSLLSLEENTMKSSIVTGLLVAATLSAPIIATAEDADSDRSHPGAFVKDSVITSKIKTKLASEHVQSLGRIHVDTDANGVVWLRGTAKTQDAADLAVSMARETDGVKDVHSHIMVKNDD
jgi:hyperosmotically inducible periplasmic protein